MAHTLELGPYSLFVLSAAAGRFYPHSRTGSYCSIPGEGLGNGLGLGVAVAVGVGFFCVAFPFRVTVAELFPLVAPLVIAIVPSSAPFPLGINSTSTARLPLAAMVPGTLDVMT